MGEDYLSSYTTTIDWKTLGKWTNTNNTYTFVPQKYTMSVPATSISIDFWPEVDWCMIALLIIKHQASSVKYSINLNGAEYIGWMYRNGQPLQVDFFGTLNYIEIDDKKYPGYTTPKHVESNAWTREALDLLA